MRGTLTSAALACSLSAVAQAPVSDVNVSSDIEQRLAVLERMVQSRTQTQHRLQEQLDTWHQERAGQQIETVDYTRFLQDIGYVIEEGPDFDVVAENVDAEIALTAGPRKNRKKGAALMPSSSRHHLLALVLRSVST